MSHIRLSALIYVKYLTKKVLVKRIEEEKGQYTCSEGPSRAAIDLIEALPEELYDDRWQVSFKSAPTGGSVNYCSSVNLKNPGMGFLILCYVDDRKGDPKYTVKWNGTGALIGYEPILRTGDVDAIIAAIYEKTNNKK